MESLRFLNVLRDNFGSVEVMGRDANSDIQHEGEQSNE